MHSCKFVIRMTSHARAHGHTHAWFHLSSPPRLTNVFGRESFLHRESGERTEAGFKAPGEQGEREGGRRRAREGGRQM